MSLLNAFRHRTLVPSLRQLRAASPVLSRSGYHVGTTLRRPEWQAQKPISASTRNESTATPARSATAGYKYPEILNIYRPSVNVTIFIGLARVSSIVVFLCGSIYFSFAVYSSPEVSTLWLPLVPLVSAIPMAATALCTGPMVHGVSVVLPSWARRSRQELLRFVQDPPADARLQLWFMRFVPWPQVREVRFAELRRLRPSWTTGISNLEHVPVANQTHAGSLWYLLARNYMGRFFVNMAQSVDKSAAPGVWAPMWERIAMAGEKRGPPALARVRSERPAYATPLRPPGATKVERPSK